MLNATFIFGLPMAPWLRSSSSCAIGGCPTGPYTAASKLGTRSGVNACKRSSSAAWAPPGVAGAKQSRQLTWLRKSQRSDRSASRGPCGGAAIWRESARQPRAGPQGTSRKKLVHASDRHGSIQAKLRQARLSLSLGAPIARQSEMSRQPVTLAETDACDGKLVQERAPLSVR